MSIQLRVGAVYYPWAVVVNINGDALTGYAASLLVDIRRRNGDYWDFGGGTPQFRSSGWTTRQAAMVEVSASNAPGEYQHAAGWDTTGLGEDVYTITVRDTGSNSGNLPQYQRVQTQTRTLDVGAIASATIASGAITASTFAASAITSTVLATDSITSTQVAASAVTEIQTGLATSGAQTTAQTDLSAIKGVGFTTGDDLHAIRARGDAAWITATGFSVPGSAMALTSGERATVQALILSDATAFPGARIDAAVSTRAVAGDAMTLANGAITAAKIATDAIGSAQIATSAVTEIQAGLALAADVTSATTSINAHTDTAVSPLATSTGLTAAVAPLATTVGLASLQTHGDGSWSTANVASLALESSLTAIKGASWSTGDNLHVLTGAVAAIPTASAPSTSAIASAVWATAEGGSAGSALHALSLLRRRTTNRRGLDAIGTLSFYADDGTTVEATVDVTDVNGDAIMVSVGDPARSSAET